LKINKNDTLRYSIYGNPDAKFDPIHWNYLPLNFDRYITICVDNSYRYWADVIELICPILYGQNIGVVCFSCADKSRYENCQNINGLNIRSAAYLIKKSLFHFSGQDWSLTLCQNNEWLNYSFLETGKKEDLFAKEYSGSIENLDRPELMAVEIFERLGIDQQIETETKLIGPSYGVKLLEMIPDFPLESPPNVSPDTLIGIRCDLVENWEFVLAAVSLGLQPIVISNTLPPLPIASFLVGVSGINLFVTEETKPEDIVRTESLGIKVKLLTREANNEKIKYNLFDYEVKVVKNWSKNNVDKLLNLNYDTRIRSKRILFSRDGLFLSTYHWRRNLPSTADKGNFILDGAEDDEFLIEADMLYYFN
jgi:hypothetical protein